MRAKTTVTKMCKLLLDAFQFVGISSRNRVPNNFNSILYFNALYQQPNGQLQIQHKQNNNIKKLRKSAYNYFSEDKFKQAVTQDIYIKIIIIIIKENYVHYAIKYTDNVLTVGILFKIKYVHGQHFVF
jgi:hypothetical protein